MSERVLSGRYALREVIGTGGMSIVYKAWDSRLRREVAVKVLRSEFSNDAEFVRRFTNEAHAVLQMHHANIVDIYGLGQDGDTRYIVMEFVSGITLKELIRQEGPIRPHRAVQMAIRILAAVDHAHKNHIVHRDIKPQNIMVNADYQVKVTDFGIARRANAPEPPQQNAAEAPEKKNVLGSVHYFSPEQASGHVADEKSDLYSVGIVLFEMLTGKVPFDGDSPEDVAIKHVRETPVAPSSIRPEISRALDQVIARALAKDGASRYQTAAEMAADLKRALRMPEGGFVQGVQSEPAAQELRRFPVRLNGRKIVYAVAWLAGLLAMAAAFMLGRGLMRSMGSSVEAPVVVQMYIEDAVDLLESEGILYTIEETPEGDTPVGTIVGQYPEAGDRLSRGSRLTLYVSTGEHSSYVPTLVGLDVHEALARISEYGLMEGSIEYIIGGEEAGTVVGQDPQPGAYVSENSRVNLVVNGESAAVPDCTGKTLEDAIILLNLNGFEIGSIIEQISDAPPDSVLSQSIAPDTRALVGEPVELTIARLDSETAYTCRAEISFFVPSASTEVRMTLEDDDGLRTVYREELGEGSHQTSLTLLSRTNGAHRLCVYVDGELLMEKDLEFR